MSSKLSILKHKTNKNNERFDNIDFIEFLAMLFVILYHLKTLKFGASNKSDFVMKFNYFFRAIFSTGAPLFFFANGFLILNKEFDLRKHIMKIIKLIVITIIWAIITLIIVMPIKGEFLTSKQFFQAVYTLQKKGWLNHLWYMGALVCIYTIFPLIKNAFDNNDKIFNYWVIISAILTFGNTLICMLITIFCNFVLKQKLNISENIFGMFNIFRKVYGYAFVYFCVGGLIGKNHSQIIEKIKTKKYVNIFSILLIISISTIFLALWGRMIKEITGKSWDTVWNGYDTIFTFINVIGIYLLSTYYKNNNNMINKYIKFVSINTFGIYFIHQIIIIALKGYLQNSIHIIVNILYAIFVMSLSLVIIRILKEMPILKKLVK